MNLEARKPERNQEMTKIGIAIGAAALFPAFLLS
jgi:hypothetical protein